MRLESLEIRDLLAANTLDFVDNLEIGSPGEKRDLQLEVDPSSGTAIVALRIQGTSGNLDPAIPLVFIQDTDRNNPANHVPLMQAMANANGSTDSVVLFEVSAGANFTIEVGGTSGSGGFLAEVMLFGSTDGDGTVSENEYMRSVAAELQARGAGNHNTAAYFQSVYGIDFNTSQYNAAFDANLNGKIDGFEVGYVESNMGGAPVILDLIGDNEAPAVEAAVAVDTGSSTTDNITSDTTGISGTITDFSKIVSAEISIVGGTGGSIDLADTNTPPSISALNQTDNEITFTLSIADLDALLGAGTVLNTGSYTLEVTTEDELGNTSITPFQLVFEFDNAAPAAPTTPDLDAGSDSGDSDTDDLTNDTTPTFTFTAEANSTVAIISDLDGQLGTATADGSGNVTFTAPTGLSEGTHVITATATDTAGNVSAASSGLSIVIDTVSPADVSAIMQTNNPTNPNLTPETTATFTGTTEANASVAILDSNSAVITTTTADGSGNFTFTGIALVLGQNDFSFVATDAAGNESDPVSFTVFRNTQPTIDAGIFSIDENSSVGAAVGTVTADSQDGPTDTLTYSITGIDSGFEGTFAINASTGAITVADTANLNFENKTSFTVEVQVIDSKGDGLGGAGLVTTQNITINVNDVNEAPVFAQDPYTLTVEENSTNPTVVSGGPIVATDVDADDQGTNLTYAITGGTGASLFDIDPTTGVVTVKTGATLDYETTDSYTLDISVTDKLDGDSNGEVGAVNTVTQTATVNLIDVNEAPVITSGTTADIAENSANGTVVTTVTATDVDEDDPPFTFAITGGTGVGVFDINTSTGEITVIDSASLNFEGGTTSFTLDIEVTDNLDGNGLGEVGMVLSDNFQLTINVTDVNDAPVAVAAPTLQIDENAAATTAVTTDGTIVADLTDYFTDEDMDTLTFSIIGGNNGAFAIDGDNIVVADSTKLDFETSGLNSYTLTILATDDGTGMLTAQQDIDIQVINLNELPIIPGGTISFPNISLLDVDDASDVNDFSLDIGLTDPENDTLTFSGDEFSVVAAQDVDGFFQLNTDGTIELLMPLSQLDLDVNGERTFTITFYMDDDNSTLTDTPGINRGPFTLQLMVTDNEAPVFVQPAGMAFTIEENVDDSIMDGDSLTPAVILEATDVENDAFTFTIEPSASNSSQGLVDLFELVLVDDMGTGDPNDDTYELVVADAAGLTFDNVNFLGATGGVFDIDLVVTDAVGRFSTKTITITVTDENNRPTFVDPGNQSVDEFVETATGSLGAESGDVVYNLGGAFSDIDAAANLSYNIDAAVLTGTSTDITGAFTIDGDEIKVDMAQLIDFEGLTPKSITLTITADDGQGEANSTVTGDITILINDLNELPIYDSPTDAFEIPFVDVDDEFLGTPIVLGNISSVLTETDPEGDTINFSQISMGGTGFEYFSLGTDGTISLIKNVPDEMFSNQERFFTLTFDYNDGVGGDSLDSNTNLGFSPFELTIRVFQNPPATFDDPGNYDFSVDENTPVSSTMVQTVSATDPEGETVTYSIDDPSGTFDIDANTGVITIIDNTALNFEANTQLTITVFAIDEAMNMTPETITVTINDVNEAPVIDNNPGPFNIDEDIADLTFVGQVMITDVDAGDSHTFEIVGGDPNGVFAIDNSGNITIADNATIDFETTDVYTLEIKVTDNGGPTPGSNKLFDSQSFTINVGDVNEAPVKIGADFALPIVDESDLTTQEITDPLATAGTSFVKRFDIDVSSFYADPEMSDVLLQVNTDFDGDTPDFTAGGHIISATFDNVNDQLVVVFEYYGVDQDRAPTEIELIAVEDTVDMLQATSPLNITVSVTNEQAVDFQFIPVLNPTIDSTNGFDGVSFANLPTATDRFADEQTFFVEIWGTTLVGQDDVSDGNNGVDGPQNAWIEGFRLVVLGLQYRDDLVDVIDIIAPAQALGEGGDPIEWMNGEVNNFNAFFGSTGSLDLEPPIPGFGSIGGDGSYVRLGYLQLQAKVGVEISNVTDLVSINFADSETSIALNGADEGDLQPPGDPENPIPRTADIETTIDPSQITIVSTPVDIVDAEKFTISSTNSQAVIGVLGQSTIDGLEVSGQGGNGVGNVTSFTGNIFVLFSGSETDPDSFEIIGSELILTENPNGPFSPGEPTTPGGEPVGAASDPANFGLEAFEPTQNLPTQVAVRETVLRIGGMPQVTFGQSDDPFNSEVSFNSSGFNYDIASGFADIVSEQPFGQGSLTFAERNNLGGISLNSNGTETSSIEGDSNGGYVLTLNLSRLIQETFNVQQITANANLAFSGTIVATTGGAVPLQGTVFVKDGQPLEDGSGMFVTVNKTRTATDASGQVAELPDNVDWASEWDSLWVEVWGNTADASGVYGGTLDLAYNTDLYTATQIEYASSMTVGRGGSIDDANGTITGLGSQSEVYTMGNGSFVLLGRVKLESLPGDGIDVSVGGDLSAESLGLAATNAKIMLSGIGAVDPDVTDVAEVDVWAVAYDANDDGKIGIADFSQFISAYGKSTLTANNALLAALDFDNSGRVGLSDFSAFIQNYGKNKLNAASIKYPETFTQMWVGKGVELNGPDSLQDVFDQAISDWQDALGWEEPIDVKLVVKDFGDAQLGEAELLGLDENGLPQFGILTLDDDGAGLGWSSDLEGGPAEGQYDLYTVILHELGHLYGFMSHYAGFADNVVTDHDGNKIFIGSDFVAVLDDYAHHLDATEHMGDVMNAALDPGQRKLISALDVQILQTAYESATSGQSVGGGSAALHATVTTQSIVEETIAPVVTEAPVSFVFDKVVDVESVSGRTGYEATISPVVYNELIKNGVRVTTSSSTEVQQQIEEVDSAVATLAIEDSSLLLADSVENAEYFATEEDSTNVDDLFAEWDFNSDLEG
ncbi:Cadherin domain protein [Bremerella volcania]|uniref:Cadherin domain protein n=2 Tax=Bremerella volcania TaxID=2527984 RepID=A0A518C721_9BACT|nr:Cadherin domain protein [Bremerella volcania]